MGNYFGQSWFTSGLKGRSSFVGKLSMFKGLIMYKIEIDISAWGGDEKVTIETSDFDKIEIIREFIDMQMDNGWAADYEQIVDLEEEEDGEDDEACTVSTYVITKIED
jgi:hypothetical protein